MWHIAVEPKPLQTTSLPLQVAAAVPEAPPAPAAAWQHGCPSAPQALVHIATPPSPPPPQPSPAPHAVMPPLQHGSPEAPHFMQAFTPIEPVDTQPRPLSHWLAPNPPQQGSPEAPHFMHEDAPMPEDTQPRPLSHADCPWQQGCPLPPQVWHIPGMAAVPDAPPLLATVIPTHAAPD